MPLLPFHGLQGQSENNEEVLSNGLLSNKVPISGWREEMVYSCCCAKIQRETKGKPEMIDVSKDTFEGTVTGCVDYQKLLNTAQLNAVTHLNGPHLVIAGAGTGKTRTLVFRVAYLVEQGVDPRSILLLTFTRKSAQEMMHRASRILDDRCSRVSGGTFHSFGNLILRKYAGTIGYSNSFTILDRTDAEEVLGMLRAELGFHQAKTRFPRKDALMNVISRSVNTGASLAEILARQYPQYAHHEDNVCRLAEEYALYKLNKSLMDYDDLLSNLKRLLEEHESVRIRLSNTYRYIMVDEYQDTNRLQAEIVQFLASEHRNVMVVGDDSQSIYSFRGANFRNIMDFPKLFPGTTVTTLEQNYRSTQPILSLTNAIISNAREKYSKKLFSNLPGRQKPWYVRPKSQFHQAELVCRQVREFVRNGTPLSDIAVLFRSGWHSNDLEVELAAHRIEFVKYGGLKFVEAAHVKDVLAFLRVGFNLKDAIAWRRVLMLLDGVGGATANRIIRSIVDNGHGYDGLASGTFSKKKYGEALAGLRDLIHRMNALELDLKDEVRMIMDFYNPYFEGKYEDFESRRNDLASLVQIAERYDSVEKFLSDLTIEPPEASRGNFPGEASRGDRLVLSTIHSAKGLEWEHVFLIHLVDGCLPSSYSVFNPESLEEERRLFYVAATRARKSLYLIAPRIEGGNEYTSYGGPSRFLFEIRDLEKLTQRRSAQ